MPTTTAPSAPPGRRTQQERREATVARLLDATIATVTEIGYAKASVKEICDRAGVSHGGLFRHFPTRLDLMVAAFEEVARRQLDGFVERFDQRPGDGDPQAEALRLLRDAARAPINAVWFELLTAGRTDDALRTHLEPVTRRYYDQIEQLAAQLPFAEDYDPRRFAAGVRLALHLFDGEATRRAVAPEPEAEDAVLALVTDLLATAARPAP